MSRSRKRKTRLASSGKRPAEVGGTTPCAPNGWQNGRVWALVLVCFLGSVAGGLALRRHLGSDATRVVPKPASAAADGVASTPNLAASPGDLGPPADLVVRQDVERRFGNFFRQGYRNFQAERYGEALQDFQQAVDTAPYLAEGHFYLGKVYHELLLADQAEACYRATLERMSDFRDAEKNLCMLLHERGAYHEAISILESMRATTPHDPFVLGELALNFLALGDAAQAIPLLNEYNELSGRQAWGTAQRGRAHELQGNLAEAERLYREAIEIDPNHDVALHWLGLILAREGRTDESREPFARYQQLRELRDTEHDLNMALLRNADDVATLIRLAETRERLGKRQAALKALQRAEQLAPNHPEIQRLRRTWVRGGGGS